MSKIINSLGRAIKSRDIQLDTATWHRLLHELTAALAWLLLSVI